MAISRRVNRQRRVGLPREMAKESGIEPQTWVTVRVAEDRRWALVMKPVRAPDDPRAAPVRDAARPRMVTEVMQVTMPKPSMEEVGLRPMDWVFVCSLGRGLGMRIVPQAKVSLREAPARRSVRSRTTAPTNAHRAGASS